MPKNMLGQSAKNQGEGWKHKEEGESKTKTI